MNNKPYGWHCFIGKGKEEQDFLFINGKGSSMPDASWDKVIPLYTHPVKEHFEDEPQAEELHEILQSNTHPVKELTDDERIQLQAEYGIDSSLTCHSVKDFVSAVLRKASDK